MELMSKSGVGEYRLLLFQPDPESAFASGSLLTAISFTILSFLVCVASRRSFPPRS